MTHLIEWSETELMYRLRQQQWEGVSTWGPGQCGHNARGSGWCAECLQRELYRRKEKPDVL